MNEIPLRVTSYKKTPEFSNETIPKGFLKGHQTKEGTWGKIVILEGKLLYRILEPEIEEIQLTPDKYGVVEPTVLHEVEPFTHVRFYIEFFR